MFEAHYASIWRLVRRLGVEQGSLDDAAQEVFWIAARKRAHIQPGKERPFLYGVARRVASSYRRKEATLRLVDGVEELPEGNPSPEELNVQLQARQFLDDVLNELTTDLRAVLVFVAIEELSLPEVARIENIPLGTVNSRLRRARAAFSVIAKRLRSASEAGRSIND